MSFLKHTIDLISSSHVCYVPTSSPFFFFYNINNKSKGFHKLQGYFKFIKKEICKDNLL